MIPVKVIVRETRKGVVIHFDHPNVKGGYSKAQHPQGRFRSKLASIFIEEARRLGFGDGTGIKTVIFEYDPRLLLPVVGRGAPSLGTKEGQALLSYLEKLVRAKFGLLSCRTMRYDVYITSEEKRPLIRDVLLEILREVDEIRAGDLYRRVKRRFEELGFTPPMTRSIFAVLTRMEREGLITREKLHLGAHGHTSIIRVRR